MTKVDILDAPHRAVCSSHALSQSSTESPRLILHADDLGLNESVTDGILQAFSQGLLTSTSILTNGPGFLPAIGRWKELLNRLAEEELPSLDSRRRLGDPLTTFDLGIHLNLTQGRPMTGERYPPALLDDRGCFPGVFALASRILTFGARFRTAIEAELCAQIESILDSGIAPTHLNAHQYVDLLPVVASTIPRLMNRYAIRVVRVSWERRLFRSTLRERFDPRQWLLGQIKRIFAFHQLVRMRRLGFVFPQAYFGTAHAGRVDLAMVQTFVGRSARGVTEICVHPGARPERSALDAESDPWHDPLAAARPAELAMLTSHELVDLLEARQIRLGRLSDLADRHPKNAQPVEKEGWLRAAQQNVR